MKYYSKVEDYWFQNKVMYGDRGEDNNFKTLFSLKLEHYWGVIRSGYMLNEANNKTMGALMDLNRHYNGFETILKLK